MKIRKSTIADLPQIDFLYPAAFPNEDLLPIVRDLLGLPDSVMSLVAMSDNSVVGNISFTDCNVSGSKLRGSLLAPLAVSPDHQRSGVGSALVREGLVLLEEQGVAQVFVLGDPAYYSRFGFTQESEVSTPYEIPAEWASAWQSLNLAGSENLGEGGLQLPEAWMRRGLWAP